MTRLISLCSLSANEIPDVSSNIYKKSLLWVVCSLKISCFPTETFRIKQSKNIKVLFFKSFQLQSDEQRLEEDYAVSTRMLESANKQLKEGLEANNMVAVSVAKSLMESACSKLKEASIHRNEKSKIRTVIGSKRKSAFRKLMKAAKKKK